jgi:MFS family permease
VLVGFGMFGAMMTIPLYLQLVNGATPTESGFLMLPMILGLMIASIGSGQLIARTGRYRMFPILGTGLMSVGFFWLTFLSVDKPVWYIMIGMFLIGLGLGQLMQTLTIAAQNSVGPRDIGVATSASTFFRQIGGTLGTAVLFSVLFTRIPETIVAAFASQSVKDGIAEAVADPAVLADPANTQILDLFQQAQAGGSGSLGTALDGDTSFLNGSDPRLAAPFLQGFNDATVTIYWVGLGVVLLAFVLSFFLKAAPLREKSALQENADADAAIVAQAAAAEAGAMLAPDVADAASTSAGSSRPKE